MTPIERAMAQAAEAEKAFNQGMTVEEYRKQKNNQQKMENIRRQQVIDDYQRMEKRAVENVNMWKGRVNNDPQNAGYYKMRLQAAKEELKHTRTQMKTHSIPSAIPNSNNSSDFITVGEGKDKHVIPRSYLK